MWQKSVPQKRLRGLSKKLKYLRKRTNACGSCWKRRYEPRSDKRLPSRGRNPAQPQKPGRKAGKQYGRRYRRPLPDTVDEVVEVPLPARCPRCGGGLEECETVSQFQTEIPEPRVERIEFRISVGRCRRCRRRVQGRHPRQTSDALGSVALQLGPRALALTMLQKSE